jgi:hypothetical protein
MRHDGPPEPVELTAKEAALASRIDFDPGWTSERERVLESCDCAAKLIKLLLKRNAIPQHRLDYFTDPEYNIGTKMSRQAVFERNGTRGDEILEHPHFLKYLRYFIYGANLPTPTVEGFCRIVRADRGTSGEVLSQLHSFARREIRDRKLPRGEAAEEFYKLALDCGLDVDRAKGVRRAALEAR